MGLSLNKKNIKTKYVAGSLRRTQLITTYGSGAIVDLPWDSVIIAGTDLWKNVDDQADRLYEENLQRFLGVDYFVKPKVQEKDPHNPKFKSQDIPAFRFPKIHTCQSCGRVGHYNLFKTSEGYWKCYGSDCGKKHITPSRFVIACKKGHLEDFPYVWWAHKGSESGCSEKDLRIYYDNKSSGLESIIIYCTKCKKGRSMEGCFNGKALEGFKGSERNGKTCIGNRPWLNDKDSAECGEVMRTLQRGASNLYFGVQTGALTIPPWSKKINLELNKEWKYLEVFASDDEMLRKYIESSTIPAKCNCSVDEVFKQAKMMKNQKYNDDEKTYEEIMEDEYRALVSGGIDADDDEEFITQDGEVPEFITDLIEQVVLVKKLREVVALRGFTRISPDFDINDRGDSFGNHKTFSKLGKKYQKWLPATELRGEGIFIKFNEDKLRTWAEKVGIKDNRYKIIINNLKKSTLSKVGLYSSKMSAEYILLHTFSHLLIKQVTLQSGYSSASIKERIYSTFNGRDNALNMYGILIYTSTPDSEGSLGGLVSQGEKDNFEVILKNMLEEAEWCSSDPLCIESKETGFDGLNHAACHSCTLLPETSCEARNCFLDRAAVVGTDDKKDFGYFAEILYKGD